MGFTRLHNVWETPVQTVRRLSLSEALRSAVEACGGSKVVGTALWPAKSGQAAMERVDHCILPRFNDKFSTEEIDFIFAWAERIGAHSAIEGWGAGRGYTVAPANKEAVIAELQTRAVALTHEAAELQRDIEAIGELSPATLQLMRAAHLKVGA